MKTEDQEVLSFNLYSREDIKGVNTKDCIHNIHQYIKVQFHKIHFFEISCEQYLFMKIFLKAYRIEKLLKSKIKYVKLYN